MTAPLVSIVIPSFNCARYIEEAITSILNQTHRECEIIVVDDGSTDDTAEVVAPLVAAQGVRYVRQENHGPGAARNTGIASGPYIAFLDADDTLERESVERRLRLLTSCHGLGLVLSDVYWEERPGEPEPWVARWGVLESLMGTAARRVEHGIILEPSFAAAFDLLSRALTNAVLVKREVFAAVGLFRTDLTFGEDQDMWYRIGQRYQVGYVDTPLATYKKYRGFVTTRLAAARRDSQLAGKIAVYESVLGERGLRPGSRKWLRRRLAWAYLDLAGVYLERKQRAEARRCVVRSLWYGPRNRLAYQMLLFPLVPRRLRAAAKRLVMKRRSSSP